MTFSYIWQFLMIMIIAAPIYAAIRILIVKYYSKKQSTYEITVRREIFMGIFFLYMAGLLILALVLGADYDSPMYMLKNAWERIQTQDAINLIPFRTIGSFFRQSSLDVFLVNNVGNIIMFIPWGFGVTYLWEKNRSVSKIILYSLILTVFIEIVQLFVGRSVDIDDLILNFVGGFIGGILCLM